MPSLPSRLRSRGRVAAGGSVLLALTLLGAGLPGADAAPSRQDRPTPLLVGETVATASGRTTAAPPDRIIVRWKAGASSRARGAAREHAHTDPVATLGRSDFQLLDLEPGQTRGKALAALRADPRVAAADPDRYLENFAMPDDPDLPKQWALQSGDPSPSASGTDPSAGAINVGPAWDRTPGTPSTVVAVIDGGYDFDVPDLGSVAWRNPGEVAGNGVDDDGNGFVDDVRGWDFVGANPGQPQPDNDPTDDDPVSGGHGAHVAGILGAQGNDGHGISGVAQNVRIMPLRVCGRSAAQTSNRCLLSAVVQAVNYAGRNGARVANLSLGGTGYDQVFADALAANPKTLYVVAAGNDHRDNDQRPVYPCSYNPVADSQLAGRVDNVLCVPALDQSGRPASFSNWGARSVDLAAPGVEIWSVYRQYQRAVVWSDDFEGGDLATRWINGSPGFGLGAGGDGPLMSSGLTDSPGTAPVAGDHQIRSRSFTVPTTAEYCEIQGERFARLARTEDFSYSLWADGADGPSTYSLAVTWPNAELKSFSTDVFDARELAGKRVSLHLDYTAPSGLDATYGVWLDNLKVTCGAVVRPAPYTYLSGTSMASPMVSGAAALLFSLKPSASVTKVRAAVLGKAKRLAAWKGLTATGGRLDVAAAMGKLVPPDTRFSAPSDVDGQSVSLHVAQNGTLPGVRFQCRLDSGDFVSCNPEGVLRGLRPGRHVLQARAIDAYGNLDPTPASSSFTVTGCLVPRLIGSSVARVREVVPKAGCRIGTVVRPPGVPISRLKVKATYPRAFTYFRTTAPIRMVLVRR